MHFTDISFVQALQDEEQLKNGTYFSYILIIQKFKSLQSEQETPLEALYGHLPEIPFHTLLQKARGQVVG
jgi:hypothetical protein